MLLPRYCGFLPCLRRLDNFASLSSFRVQDKLSSRSKCLKLISAYGTTTSHQVHKVWYRKEGVAQFIGNLSKDEKRELMEELSKHQISPATEDIEDAKKKTLPLNSTQLRYVALFSAVPFIGFGLLDNTFMLIAGEYIDITFGAMLGITTMAAAALGNMVSDVLGITTAGFVEQTASRLGLKPPALSFEQLNSRSYHWIANLGKCVGVVIGCVLGMWPLLLVKEKSCAPVMTGNGSPPIKKPD